MGVAKPAKKAAPVKGKKHQVKFTIDCRLPIEDNVIVLSDFADFLKQSIKVEGKKGNIAGSVNVSTDKASIVVEPKITFSKRYLKYLSKKYLKKQNLKEFMRVISTKKNTYELKYFQI